MAVLSSRVCADLNAVEEVDLSYRGSFEAKHVLHVSDVSGGLNRLPYAPVTGEGLDVDL